MHEYLFLNQYTNISEFKLILLLILFVQTMFIYYYTAVCWQLTGSNKQINIVYIFLFEFVCK